MIKKVISIFVLFTSILFINNGYSHSGRTNSEGCHNKYSDGTYHCHNKKY